MLYLYVVYPVPFRSWNFITGELFVRDIVVSTKAVGREYGPGHISRFVGVIWSDLLSSSWTLGVCAGTPKSPYHTIVA